MVKLSSARKKLLKDGIWSSLGKVTTALGTLVGVRLLTEFLPKEVYGKLSLLVGLMVLASNFFTGPLFLAAQRFYSEAAISRTIWSFRHTIVSILKKTTFHIFVVYLLSPIWFGKMSCQGMRL